MTSFNINEKVKVRLTEHGRAILEADINPLNYCGQQELLDYAYEKIRPDSDGYNSFQMWQLMSIFGDKMYNGAENVFESNLIHLDI